MRSGRSFQAGSANSGGPATSSPPPPHDAQTRSATSSRADRACATRAPVGAVTDTWAARSRGTAHATGSSMTTSYRIALLLGALAACSEEIDDSIEDQEGELRAFTGGSLDGLVHPLGAIGGNRNF